MAFTALYDATILALENRLSELIDNGLPFDLEKKGDVLQIEFEDGERIVITPQSSLDQIWISADYSGHRFQYVSEKWIDEKGGEPMNNFLERMIGAKLGRSVDLATHA